MVSSKNWEGYRYERIYFNVLSVMLIHFSSKLAIYDFMRFECYPGVIDKYLPSQNRLHKRYYYF